MLSAIKDLTDELRLSRSSEQSNNLGNAQPSQSNANESDHAAPYPMQKNHANSSEMKRLRRRLYEMEDRMDYMNSYNRAYPPAPQVQYQESDKMLNYLLLIIGCVAFLYLPIVGIPILASAVAVSCGATDRKQDIENYLNAVHQNQHIRDDEMRNLKLDIRELRRDLKYKSIHGL